MSWLHGLSERFKALFYRDQLEDQLDEEIRFHIEMETEHNIRAGMSREEARRRAERAFGRVEATKESVRDERGVTLIEDVVRETRFAVRRLRKRPAFGTVVVVTLGLGIGATTAIFSVVNSVLLQPLPFPDAGRLVLLGHEYRPEGRLRRLGLTDGSYFIYREQSRLLVEMGGFGRASMNLSEGERPERVTGAYVTASLFATMQVAPILGRAITEEEDQPDAEPVIVISEGLWRRRFGGSPDILGRTLRVDNVGHEVVGVMPSRFTFPTLDTEMWRPLKLDPSTARSINYWMPAVGRLAPGVTAAEVAAELDALFPRQFERFPNEFGGVEDSRADGMRPTVRPLKEVVVGGVRETLWVLFAAVGLILVIACTNVANLSLVQAEEQERELAMRRALGASGGQLARYFLAESLLLGLLGGLLGTGLAHVGLRVLVANAPRQLPRTDEIGIDATVLAVTVALSVIAALAFGALPLLRRAHPATAMSEAGRRATPGKGRGRTRDVLAVAQLGLALVLMAGSGLMLRTFWNLRSVELGFEPERLLTFQLALPSADYADPNAMGALHVQLVERLSSLPGVVAAAGVWTGLPLEEAGAANSPVETDFTPAGTAPLSHPMKVVTPGYFDALGIPLLAGRTLQRRDFEDGTGAAVVSAAFARRYWTDLGSAIGGRFRLTPEGDWYTIVGVVGDTHDEGLRTTPPEQIYWALRGAGGEWYFWPRAMDYAVRTEETAQSLVPAIRRVVHEIDPDLPIYAVQRMDEIVSGSMAETAFTMVLLSIGALMALIIGAVGIYGVMSYAVTQRTREIGVRMALGAAGPAIVGMVLRRGLLVTAIGAGLGVLGAIGVTRALRSLLFGVQPVDPLTYAGVALALASVGLAATYVPARRAARVDPIQALRHD